MRIKNETLIVENFAIRPANIEIVDNSIWLVAIPMNNRLDAYDFCEKYHEGRRASPAAGARRAREGLFCARGGRQSPPGT